MWKTTFVLLAIAFSLAFGNSIAQRTITPAHAATSLPIVIDYDGGGSISTYMEWYRRLKEARTPVVLRGICISACTFILMLPKDQVCVEPTASLAFHLATDGDGPDEAYTQALIRRYYPPAVQKFLDGKKLKENREEYLTATDIVTLGIFPACKS